MRKISLLFLISIIASITFAGESVTVGTNSIVLLPNRAIKPPAWVGNTNSYSVGQYVRNEGKNYLVVGAGVATSSAPTHISGLATNDGVVYRYIKSGPRRSAVIVNDSTNVIYVSEDGPAVLNKGIRVNANGAGVNFDASDQEEITAISASAGNNVTISDR